MSTVKTPVFLKKQKYAFFAAGCTTLIILGVYLANVIYPFGMNSILCVDLLHQYAPLYAELWDKVMSGGSLLFSWESAGGADWLGNFFNYLSSPFTFIILLFPRENITEAIALIILLKSALASFTFSVFINKKAKNKNCFISAFGVLYACCGWFVAYYWNVMWLDALYLLPVVLLGIERIIDKKHSALYILALAATIVTSYYMAYMICIFSVAYFLYYFFINNNKVFEKKRPFSFKKLKNNSFINRGFNFAFSSFGAALICAVVILPLVSTLNASSATKDTFPEEFTTYFNIFDFLTQHFTGIEPTIRCSNVDMYLPNISCGVLTVLLVPLFFLSKTISKKEKLLSGALLAFLVSGFYVNYLDFVWHGFHFPNDMPYRFSFIYSFVLLMIGFRALEHIKEIPKKLISFVVGSIIMFLLLMQKLGSENFDEITFWISLVFVAVYYFGLFLLNEQKYQVKTIALLILVLICTEYTIGNSNKYTVCVARDDYTYNYESFVEIKDMTEDETSFYRTEMLKGDVYMSPCRYGYNGISYFSSMANQEFTYLQCKLGMQSNNINSCIYNSQTPIYNAFFAIKNVYINKYNCSQFLPHPYFEYKTQNVDFIAYENKYALPLGFAVDDDITKAEFTDTNAFLNQERLFDSATGVGKVFEPLEFSVVSYDNIKLNEDVLTNDNKTPYSLKYVGDANIKMEFKANSSGEAFIYIFDEKGNIDNVNIANAGEQTSQEVGSSPYIISVGNVNEGDCIDVNLDIIPREEEKELIKDKLYVYGAVVDQKKFEKGYQKLTGNPFEITEFSDTHFSGKINMPEDSILYTSVPYDKGWHIKVDGKSADDKIVKIGDALIGVDLDEGEHNIEFTYSATGLYEGAAISILTIAVLLLLFIIKNKKK